MKKYKITGNAASLALLLVGRYDTSYPPTTKYGDPDYRPYCLNCTTMMRMIKTHSGFRCRNCQHEIDHDDFKKADK